MYMAKDCKLYDPDLQVQLFLNSTQHQQEHSCGRPFRKSLLLNCQLAFIEIIIPSLKKFVMIVHAGDKKAVVFSPNRDLADGPCCVVHQLNNAAFTCRWR